MAVADFLPGNLAALLNAITEKANRITETLELSLPLNDLDIRLMQCRNELDDVVEELENLRPEYVELCLERDFMSFALDPASSMQDATEAATVNDMIEDIEYVFYRMLNNLAEKIDSLADDVDRQEQERIQQAGAAKKHGGAAVEKAEGEASEKKEEGVAEKMSGGDTEEIEQGAVEKGEKGAAEKKNKGADEKKEEGIGEKEGMKTAKEKVEDIGGKQEDDAGEKKEGKAGKMKEGAGGLKIEKGANEKLVEGTEEKHKGEE